MGNFKNTGNVFNPALTPLKDFLFEISRGNVPGHSLLFKFGENPDIDNDGLWHDIWDGGGTYTFWNTLVAQSMEMVSDGPNDTGITLSSGTATDGTFITLVDTGATFATDGVAIGDIVLNTTTNEYGYITNVQETVLTHVRMTNGAGNTNVNKSGNSYKIVTANSTGAAVVQIYGLDINYNEIYESVILNGAGAVNLTKTYIRMYRMKVLISGSSYTNEGTLTCRIQGAGTTAAIIQPDYGQTLMAIYTVPANKTGYFVSFQTTMGGTVKAATVSFQGLTREYLGSWQIKEAGALIGDGTSSYNYLYNAIPFYQKTDFKGRAKTTTNNTVVNTKFSLILVDDGY